LKKRLNGCIIKICIKKGEKMKATVDIEKIIDLLNSLNERMKDEVLRRVFISYDDTPLSLSEKKLIKKAEDDYKNGNVVRCKIGK